MSERSTTSLPALSTTFYTIELRIEKLTKGRWRATATCRGTGVSEKTCTSTRTTKNAAAVEVMKNAWQLSNFLGEQQPIRFPVEKIQEQIDAHIRMHLAQKGNPDER